MSFASSGPSSQPRPLPMPSSISPVDMRDSRSTRGFSYDRPESVYSSHHRSSSPSRVRGPGPYHYPSPVHDFDREPHTPRDVETYRPHRSPESIPYRRDVSELQVEEYYYRSRDPEHLPRLAREGAWMPPHRVAAYPPSFHSPPPLPPPEISYEGDYRDYRYDSHRRWHTEPDALIESSVSWRQRQAEGLERPEVDYYTPSTRQRSRTAEERPITRDVYAEHYSSSSYEERYRVEPAMRAPASRRVYLEDNGRFEPDGYIPRDVHRDYVVDDRAAEPYFFSREDRMYETLPPRTVYDFREPLYPASSGYDRHYPTSRDHYVRQMETRPSYREFEGPHSRSMSRRVSNSSQRSTHPHSMNGSPSSNSFNRSGPVRQPWNRDTPMSAASGRGGTRASSAFTDKLLPKEEPEDPILPPSRRSPGPINSSEHGASSFAPSRRYEDNFASPTSRNLARSTQSDSVEKNNQVQVAEQPTVVYPIALPIRDDAQQLKVVAATNTTVNKSHPHENPDRKSPLSATLYSVMDVDSEAHPQPAEFSGEMNNNLDDASGNSDRPGQQVSSDARFAHASDQFDTTDVDDRDARTCVPTAVSEPSEHHENIIMSVNEKVEHDGGVAHDGLKETSLKGMRDDTGPSHINELHREEQVQCIKDSTTQVEGASVHADRRSSPALAGTVDEAMVNGVELKALTPEPIVDMILNDNLYEAENNDNPPWPRRPTSPDALVKEIFAKNIKEAEDKDMPAILAAHFSERDKFIAEKQERLKKEYMELQEKWVANCARLDSIYKAGATEELHILTSRATRRSVVTSDAVRSDLEMERIIASLGNEDLTDPNQLAVRNTATIPDMISVVKGEVDYTFDDTNNRVDDPETFYDARTGFVDWTDEEKKIFYDKYSEHPKQFAIIAESLPNKTTAQCVLYYYIHKKRLVDFRKAANAGANKKRGGRPGKQKSNALLADIQIRDEEKPRRGRRKGPLSANNPTAATPAEPEVLPAPAAPPSKGPGKRPAEDTPTEITAVGDQPSAEPTPDAESRPKRRKAIHWAKGLQSEADVDGDVSMETESVQEPPKKKRGRKPKAFDSPAASPPADGSKPADSENVGRRKGTSTTAYWSEKDKADFLRLLAKHGKNFKLISASMPNKTTVQVNNYFKNHSNELGLEKVAALALNHNRSESPSGEAPSPQKEQQTQQQPPQQQQSMQHSQADSWMITEQMPMPIYMRPEYVMSPAKASNIVPDPQTQSVANGAGPSSGPGTASGSQESSVTEAKPHEQPHQMWYREDFMGPSPFLRPHHPYQPHNGMSQPQHRYMAVLHPPPVPIPHRGMGTPPMMHSGAGVFQVHHGGPPYPNAPVTGFASMPPQQHAPGSFQFSAYKPPSFQPFSTRALRGYGMTAPMHGQMGYAQMHGEGVEALPQQGVFMERRIHPAYAMPPPPPEPAAQPSQNQNSAPSESSFVPQNSLQVFQSQPTSAPVAEATTRAS